MHHFLTTGFLTFLGLVLDLVQTSLGTSTHSSVGSSLGTSLVTCLQVLWGSRVHCSLGAFLHNGLDFVVAFLSTLLEATACGGTKLPGLLGAASDRGVLLHWLLGDRANLPGPLGALGVGGVSRGLVLTLLLNLSGALNHIVLNIVSLLLGPALGFVLGPADLGSLDITVLNERGPADLSSFVEGNLLVFDETVLPEVLFTVLLLLGLVVGDIGGVAPPVIGVVALDDIVVLGLLHHLDLVNTPLAISTRTGSSNGGEAHISVVSLTLSTGLELNGRVASIVVTLTVVTMVVTVMCVSTLV